MPEPTLQELNESIKEVSDYRDRLHGEVLKVAQKLKMNQRKIDSTLETHIELQYAEEILSKLITQRDLISKESL